MRKKALIVTMAFCLLSAVSDSGMFASVGKEAPVPDPPACPAKFDDRLETHGIVSGVVSDFQHGVAPPKPTNTPEATFSQRARKSHIKNAVSILSMVVGVDGIPRDVCLVKAAGYDLDAKAAEAVWKYRFDPATKDGSPVPSRITIEVKFKLYRGFW